MKRILLVMLLVFSLGMGVYADGDDTAKITVTGTGRIKVSPDIATINMAVETSGRELAPIKKDNDDKIEAAVKALSKAGIERKDYYTSNFNISSRYVEPYKEGKERKKDYFVRNNLFIVIRDIERVGEIITILESNGVNNIQNISYSSSVGEEKQLEALELAYINAKNKAERIAKLENMKVEISNISTDSYMPRPQYEMAMMDSGSLRAKSATPIYAPEDIDIIANISATFSMKK